MFAHFFFDQPPPNTFTPQLNILRFTLIIQEP